MSTETKPTINFEDTEFPELILAVGEFIKGFNSVDLDLLGEEGDAVAQLLAGCATSPDSDEVKEIDESDVLLLKANDFGDIERLYAPQIGKKENDDGELVVILKIGANEFPVSLSKGMFSIGSLTGFFQCEANETKYMKDGEERSFRNCYLTLEGDGYSYDWRVGVRVNAELGANTAPLQKAQAKAKSIEDILDFLGPVSGGGGGSALKIPELVEGVELPRAYKVSAVKSITGQYGESFILTLADGRSVWSRGQASKQLAVGYEERFGMPAMLMVNECKQRRDGKWQVSCRLMKMGADGDRNEIGVDTPKAAIPAEVPTKSATAAELQDMPF